MGSFFAISVFKLGGGEVVERGVGAGVAAEGLAGGAPGLEDGEIRGGLFELGGVDEAVDGREVLRVKRVEDGVGDVEAGLAGREVAVSGQVVEGEGDLLGVEAGGEEKEEGSGEEGFEEDRLHGRWRSHEAYVQENGAQPFGRAPFLGLR